MGLCAGPDGERVNADNREAAFGVRQVDVHFENRGVKLRDRSDVALEMKAIGQVIVVVIKLQAGGHGARDNLALMDVLVVDLLALLTVFNEGDGGDEDGEEHDERDHELNAKWERPVRPRQEA